MYNFIEMFAPSFLFGVLNTCMSLKYKNKIFIFNSVLNILYVITYKCNMLTLIPCHNHNKASLQTHL